MQLRHSWVVLTALAGVVGLGAACSATARTGFTGTANTGGSSTSTGGSGNGASTGTGAMTGMGGSITLTGTGGSSATCDTHCSADLHSVLDCNNTVVTTCAPSMGCGATGCVAACDAAQQNKSTIGCDYYAVDPDIIAEGRGACFAAFIANTWNGPVTISVERAGQMLGGAAFSYIPTVNGTSVTYTPLTSGQLQPGEVAIVFLSQSPNPPIAPCPEPAGYPMEGSVTGTGIGDAFHITTSAPVVAYDIFPYGGGSAAATSATLLIPTTAWDTNYIAIDAYAQSQLVAPEGANPSMDIVASMDATTVTILPTVDIVAGPGVAGASANTPQTYNLNKGQVLQISQPQELIGSVIQSNNPVGHWAGASCLNIPVGTAACDSAHQQIPPVKALGHEYVAVRYPNRFAGMEESPPWRLVGAVNGTLLTWDPAPPSGAPLTLKQGQLVEFNAAGPFTVSSQDAMHPFYMAAFMTGAADTNPSGTDSRGDPEFVNVIPPQQYLSSYTFFTDPTYPETNLVLIRSKGTAGFSDVKLDCAGTLSGWTPVGAAGDFEYTTINLVTGNFQGQNGCNNGVHQISSAGLFGLAVWGWGSAATGESPYSQFVSYSYPAGASVQPINTVVIPPMPQ